MPITPLPPIRPARANGWTPRRKRQFFETLAAHGTVAVACARVGLSREAAYKARRRDPDFAHRWQQALECARLAAERAFFDGLPAGLRETLQGRLQFEPEAWHFLSELRQPVSAMST